MDAPLSNACSDWLRRSPGGPFLLVASFMNPHDICDWIRQHKGTREYPAAAAMPPAPLNMAVDPNEPEAIQYHRTAGYDLMSQAVGIASEWRRDDVRLYLHDYYRMVEQVDGEIGKVLTALRESGQERNTVIVFASDHGEGLGGHRWAQKASFYEESLRVPFFVAGPGVATGVNGRVDDAGRYRADDVRAGGDCRAVRRARRQCLRRIFAAVRDERIALRHGRAGGPHAANEDVTSMCGSTPARGPNSYSTWSSIPARRSTWRAAEERYLEAHRRLMNQWLSTTGDGFARI